MLCFYQNTALSKAYTVTAETNRDMPEGVQGDIRAVAARVLRLEAEALGKLADQLDQHFD